MMKKTGKKVVAVVSSVMLLLGCLVGCGNASDTEISSVEITEETNNSDSDNNSDNDNNTDTIRIAFISPAQHYDFFVYLCAGAKKRAEELNVQLDVFDGQEDFPLVGELITHAVANNYDAICTGGFEAIIPAAKEANEAGIPLINFDARLESDEVTFMGRVASDNAEIGKADAQWIIDDMNQRTDKDQFVIYYINFMSSASNTQRCAGFVQQFEDMDNVELREIIPSAGTVEATQTLIDDLLIGQPQGSIDYIFGSSAGMGVGALASVTSAERNEIKILSVDDEQGLLDALQTDGPFVATVAQNAAEIGAMTVDAALKAINGEDAGDVAVPVRVITKENVKQDIEEQTELKNELNAYK